MYGLPFLQIVMPAWIVQVVGTWDDHDYGLNDAGKEFGGKKTNQRLLLDFLDEPQDSPRSAVSPLMKLLIWGFRYLCCFLFIWILLGTV